MARACGQLIDALRDQNTGVNRCSHRVANALRLLNEATDGHAAFIVGENERQRQLRNQDELKRLRKIVREDYEHVAGTQLQHGEDPNDR